MKRKKRRIKWKNIFIAILLFISIFSILTFFLIKYVKKENEDINKKEEIIKENKLKSIHFL